MTVERNYITSVAEIFAAVVAQQPAAAALRWSDGRVVTYAELDRLANRAARLLLEHGVHKRHIVAVALEKSTAAYAVLLASLKIGAAYVVIDPSSPAARARAIASQCSPAFAVADAAGVDVFDCPTRRLADAETTAWLDGYDDDPVVVPWTIDGSDPAYVMFTSGSTGTPKGATISQNNLLHFVRWAQAQYAVGPRDVVTSVNPLFFDNSVFDIYASLFSGAALAPFTAAEVREPAALLAAIDRLGCTVYFSVPSLLIYLQRLKLVGPESFRTLTRIIFGGEGYPKPMLQKLYAAIGHRVELHNVYGPTECTCICSSYRISAADFTELSGYPPLGGLIRNFSSVVVDERGRPAAPGESGELYLGGPCVGLGYYGAAAQTAAAFVQNPTHDRFHDRMYRTGDLVRLDAGTGKLHFVGRADRQVKLQGYRIELGEIEHAMQRLADVDEAAAVFSSNGTLPRITGFVSGPDVRADAVRQGLAGLLPRYMIPERLVVLDGLPKNANGKVDRLALAAAVDRGDY